MDLVNETISWLQNGEPVTGGSGGDSAGVLNRPLVQLLANDNGLQDRVDIFADDDGYIKKAISSGKITESFPGVTARVQIDAAGLKQYDGTNKCADFDESGNITLGYDSNNQITLSAGVLEALLNRLQIVATGNSGISLDNSVGIAVDIADAGQYGVKIGNCTTGGYGPLHLVNAGVALGSLDGTYGNAEVDTLAIDSNHDLCIKTGVSTWQKVGATASPVAVVDTSVITGTATSSSAVVMDANGLTMRNGGGNVRFDVNEDGSWTLGDAAGQRIIHTAGDALSWVGGTLTSPLVNEAVALTATATELNLLDGVSGLVQSDFTKLAAIDASAADINKVTNFEETVSATTSEVSILASKNLNVVGHDGATYGLKLANTLVTATAAEINQLDGNTVGGSSAGDIVTIDATQTLINKSISASQVNSGTLATARIPDLDASKIISGDLVMDTSGQQVIIKGFGSSATGLVFDGTSYDLYHYLDSAGNNIYVEPSSDSQINYHLGYSSGNRLAHIELASGGAITGYVGSTFTMNGPAGGLVVGSDITRCTKTNGSEDLGDATYRWGAVYTRKVNLIGNDTDANADAIELDGSSYNTRFWADAIGDAVYIHPDTGNVVEFFLGKAGTASFKNVEVNSTDTIKLFAYGDSNNNASILIDGNDGTEEYIEIKIESASNEREYRFIDDAFYPVDPDYHDLGRSGNEWQNLYVQNSPVVGDYPYLDYRLENGKKIKIDDIAVIESIKPSDRFNAVNGMVLIDDNTIPDWLKFKNPKTGEIAYNGQGKPYLDLKDMVSLSLGGIRQLNREFLRNQEMLISRLKILEDKINNY